jgi:hypothetical protein
MESAHIMTVSDLAVHLKTSETSVRALIQLFYIPCRGSRRAYKSSKPASLYDVKDVELRMSYVRAYRARAPEAVDMPMVSTLPAPRMLASV